MSWKNADSPEAVIFDQPGTLERFLGDKQLVQTIAAGFIGDIPQQLIALRQFFAAGDSKSVERQAHSIKGAAANVGGEALRQAATELEHAARVGHLHHADEQIASITKQFDQLAKVLTATIIVGTE